MMPDKDLTDDVLDEIIAGAKTSMEQYLALSLKAERTANQQQRSQQNIPEKIPGGLVDAVNNLLNNDGSRGCYSAIGCGEARDKIELWLAQRQKWESQRHENLCALNSPATPDGWIPVSERMPENATGVLVASPWQCAPGGYAMKWAVLCPSHPDADSEGWIIPGASWSPTHWMPLPAAPKEVG